MSNAINTEELTEILDRVREEAEVLHGILDSYIDGRISELSGQDTRNRLNLVLGRIDQHLARIEEPDVQPVKGRFPAAMRNNLASAREHSDRLRSILWDSYRVRNRRIISLRDHQDAFRFLNAMDDELQALDVQMR